MIRINIEKYLERNAEALREAKWLLGGSNKIISTFSPYNFQPALDPSETDKWTALVEGIFTEGRILINFARFSNVNSEEIDQEKIMDYLWKYLPMDKNGDAILPDAEDVELNFDGCVLVFSGIEWRDYYEFLTSLMNITWGSHRLGMFPRTQIVEPEDELLKIPIYRVIV